VDQNLELHVFCDASEFGFAAVAYLRQAGENVLCSFLAARSHVAPLKSVLTIPKLELQGGVMAVRLGQTLMDELGLPLKTFFWTDALTVLRYIFNESRRWKIFVANRVAEIREKSEPSQWRYVPSSVNPADCATRGMHASQLTADSTWFRGPEFLMLSEDLWPLRPDVGAPADDDEDLKKSAYANVTVTAADASDDWAAHLDLGDLIDPLHFSSWFSLKRRTAWILRSVRNFKAGCMRFILQKITNKQLQCRELLLAETLLIRKAQQEGFPNDYRRLCMGDNLDSNSNLHPLSPIFDSSTRVIRVGGRLKNSPGQFESKHQVLLPYGHHVTMLIVREEHLNSAHAGPEQVIASVRQKFWPVKCRILAKQSVKECMDCRRRSVKAVVPLVSNLPAQRVTGWTRPFEYTGVDYFGPMLVKRARARVKKWGCLFTCLVTRAVHLELVDSMEADDFIMVLRCFVSRRGKPKEMFSDNGTNFVGAMRELQDSLQELNENDSLHSYLLKSSIQWHFIPPQAPHFGGAWERLVRSTKLALKAVLKENIVSEMVLRTALAEVEDVINSRPLTHNSVDPNDFSPLTPNHFLRGGCTSVGPPGQFLASELDSRRRWRQSQVLANHLWQRWLTEYLPSLTVRHKWTKDRRNLAVDDLVIVIDEQRPRGQWLLGRVVEVMQSEDGRIRTVKVKTPQGIYTRPAAKICLLEENVCS
jgi:hypothetical protein